MNTLVMGIFSNILGGSDSVSFNQEESVLALLIGMVASDGHISDDEVSEISRYANKTRILGPMTQRQFSDGIEKIFKVLKREGLNKLVEQSIPQIPPGLKLSVFAVCADLLFADGSVEKEEEDLLEMLKTGLHISTEGAMKIVEVISVKNQL